MGGLDIEACKKNGINLEIIEIEDDPGFEASTYLHHMYTKYDDLNDYTVFIQAHPQIYVANVIDILNTPSEIKHTFYKRQHSAESSGVNRILDLNKLVDFQPFSDTIVRCTNANYNWALYKDNYENMPWFEFCKNMPHSYKEDGKWVPIPYWDFGAGNQFIASKEIIRVNDKILYKKMQDFVNSYMDPYGDSRPYWQQLNQGPNVMEGIWAFVFTK